MLAGLAQQNGFGPPPLYFAQLAEAGKRHTQYSLSPGREV
jgi:hypothetical protein